MMLSFRNLHSTKVSSKPLPLLSVQNIIETYDFNGLKVDVPPLQRKQHPLYTNFIIKDLQIKRKLHASSKDIKEHSQVNAVKENEEAKKDQVSDSLTTNSSKNPLRLSMYISDHSEQVVATKNHAPIFDESYLMSYSAFLNKFCENHQLEIDKRANKPKRLSKVTCQRAIIGKCYLCDSKFSSKIALAKHRSICSRKSQKKLVVKTLAQKLIQKVKLKKNKQQPKEKKPRVLYPCTKCTDQFLSQSSLNAHLKFDHRPRPTCKLCNRMFDCRRKLVEHEENCAGLHEGAPSKKQTLGEIEFKATTEIHMCILCENPFPTSQELRQHKLLLNKRLPFDIEVTKDKTTEIDNSQKENFEIYVKKNPVYSIIKQPNPYVGNDCQNCRKLFNNEKRLKQHQTFCHTKTLRTCPYCQKLFRGMYQRNQHLCYCSKRKKLPVAIKVLSTDNMKTYECQCNETFDTIAMLNDHLTSKHGETYCAECEKTYPENVIRYYGVHFCIFTQSRELTTPFAIPSNQKCLLCSEKLTFRTFIKPTIHNCKSEILKFSFTGSESQLENRKKPKTSHVCNDCHKKFKNEKKLLMHKHKLSQPQTCVFCTKTFSFSNNYIRHMHLKHNKRCCPNCLHIYSHWNQIHNCPSVIPKRCFAATTTSIVNGDSCTTKSIEATIPTVQSTKDCKMNENGVVSSSTPMKTEKINPEIRTSVIDTKYKKSSCKAFRCYICSKELTSKGKLLEHLCSHSKLRPYKCRRCDYRANLALTIKCHAFRVHGLRVDISRRLDKLQRLHKIELCTKCNTYFIDQPMIRKHVCSKNSNDCNMVSPTFVKNDNQEISYLDNISSTASPILAFIPKPSTDTTTLLNKDKFFVDENLFISCEHCLLQFTSSDSLELHLKCCTKKLNCVMPVGPSLEACLNFNTSQDDQTKMTDDVMSLQEAEESLLSLIGLNNNSTASPIESLSSTERVSSPISPTEQVTSPVSSTCSEMNLIEKLLMQEEIPLITTYSIDDTPSTHISTDNTIQTVKRKRGRPRKSSVGLQISSPVTEEFKPKPKSNTTPTESPNTSRRSSLSRRCKQPDTINQCNINLTDFRKSPTVTLNDVKKDKSLSAVTQNDVNVSEEHKQEIESSTKIDEKQPFLVIDTLPIFPCEFCGINFDTEKSLDIHTENTHKSNNGTTSESNKTRGKRKKESSVSDDDICITNVKSMRTDTKTFEIKQLQIEIDNMFNASFIPIQSQPSNVIDNEDTESISGSSNVSVKDSLCSSPEAACQTASGKKQSRVNVNVVIKDIVTTTASKSSAVDEDSISILSTDKVSQPISKQSEPVNSITPHVVAENKPTVQTIKSTNNTGSCNEKNKVDNKKQRVILISDSGFDLTKELFKTNTSNYTKTKTKDNKVAESNKKTKNNILINKPKLKPQPKNESLKRYRKLKPHEREKAILKDMVEQANERKKTHVKQPVNKVTKQTPAKSMKDKIKPNTTGAEYSHGITNYFADIMLKSTTNPSERKKSDYLNKIKSRFQKEFEVNRFGQLSPVIDRGLPLVSNEVDTKKTTEGKADNMQHQLTDFEQKLRTQSKCIANNIKNDALKKPKLLINQKNLNELRLKVRKKSVEITTEVNKTINGSKGTANSPTSNNQIPNHLTSNSPTSNSPTPNRPILNSSTSNNSTSCSRKPSMINDITEQNLVTTSQPDLSSQNDSIKHHLETDNETIKLSDDSLVAVDHDTSNRTTCSSENDNTFDDKTLVVTDNVFDGENATMCNRMVNGFLNPSNISDDAKFSAMNGVVESNGILDSTVDYSTLAKIMNNVKSLPLVGQMDSSSKSESKQNGKEGFDFLEDY